MPDTNEIKDTDEFAQDIRAVDGDHKLGAAELAEKLANLGYRKHAKYPFEDGDTIVLGPELFIGQDGSKGEGVISYKGENFYRTHDGKPPVRAEEKKLTLKDYKDGEKVEVFSAKAGDFIPGFIQDRDKVSGHLHVHTDRGPVTVGTTNYIRKAAQS